MLQAVIQLSKREEIKDCDYDSMKLLPSFSTSICYIYLHIKLLDFAHSFSHFRFIFHWCNITYKILIMKTYKYFGQSWRSGTKCDCKTDWLWVRSLLEEIKYLFKFIFIQIYSSAIQHAIPPEFGWKWGTECLNTRFPLPILLCAGYGVKLIFFYKYLNVTGFEPAPLWKPAKEARV